MKRSPGAVTRRLVVAGMATLAVAPAARCETRAFRPENFGAKGDGATDDTLAFMKMSVAVTRAGGGTISLSRKIYMVGRQVRARPPQYLFEPLPIIDLVGLPLGVDIQGNGAILKARPGARYGSFAPDGSALVTRLPFYDGKALASPYRFMIRVEESRGPVTIADVELDGNIAAMQLGGEWGDAGRQIPMTGIGLFNNSGSETLTNIFTHHHGQDGLIIDGIERPGVESTLEKVRCDANGRQGCSIVGGAGYRFVDCDFTRTGRGPVASAPAAGVDIESEGGKRVHAIRFDRCRFDDCVGAGMVADSGPSSDIAFNDCLFIGTTNYAAWPSKPAMRFDGCQFIGAVVRAFASNRAELATQFVDCTFRDYDPGSSRPVYGADGSVPMVDLGGSYQAGLNTLFDHCTFDFRRGGKLPWTAGSIYTSVTMRQASPAPSYPRGRYRGISTITGPAVLASTTVEGRLTLNGRPVR